jgi:protein transport protein SEC13
MTSNASPAGAATPQDTPQGPIYIDTQHDNMVHDAQLDYYGCKLATSSSGKSPKMMVSFNGSVPFSFVDLIRRTLLSSRSHH